MTYFWPISVKELLSSSASLKIVSTIFNKIFIFPPNDSPLKTIKNVFFFLQKSSFGSQDIHIFVILFLPFYTFQIQKDIYGSGIIYAVVNWLA